LSPFRMVIAISTYMDRKKSGLNFSKGKKHPKKAESYRLLLFFNVHSILQTKFTDKNPFFTYMK